jgi:hypothetical protein
MVEMAETLKIVGKKVSQGIDHLDSFMWNLEHIFHMHDSVEIIRSDGIIVRLK